jgi:hypothetical protein
VALAALTGRPPQRRARGSESSPTLAASVSDSSWPRNEELVGAFVRRRGRRTRLSPRRYARSVRADLHGLRRELRFADFASRSRPRLVRAVASFFGSLRVCFTSTFSRFAACALGDAAARAPAATGTATDSAARDAATTAIQRTCPH